MSQTGSGKALLRQALYDGGQSQPVATATAVGAAYDGQLAYAVEVKQEESIGYAPGWGNVNSKHTSAPNSGYTPYTTNPPHAGGWNGFPTGSPAGSQPGFDPSFFQDYDATNNQVQSLSHVENDIQVQRAEIKRLKDSISTWESKLSNARKQQPRLEKRIHRNENPRFFHYLQINRHEKVNQLKQTRDSLVSGQEQWTSSKQRDEGQLKDMMTALTNSESLARTRDQLENKLQSMFDQVADSVPPTPRLNQINSNIFEQTGALRVEQMLLDQVNGTLSTLDQVQKLYNESMGMLQRAARDNRTAQFVNFADAGDRNRGPDYFERMKQAQRDQLINAAQGPADQAYMLADRAWATFPSEARARYPTLAAQIGKAPMPRLRGANFGNTLMAGFAFGNIGDAINNAHASGKIEQNMQVIEQARSIITTQTALVMALRDAIANNVVAMKGQLRTLTGQRVEERTSIFESIRARVMQQFGHQPPAVAYQKSRQDAYAPSAPPAW